MRLEGIVTAAVVLIAGAAGAAQAPTPAEAERLFRRGLALHEEGRHAEAADALAEAERLGAAAPAVQLRLARSLARAGRTPEATAALRRAAEKGFGGLATIESDLDLAPVRAAAGWSEVREAVDRNMRPCAYAPEYRELDFWVGEWDVTAAAAAPGTPPAQSRIERVEDECVILETYTTPNGYSGRSLNVYDRDHRRWEQFWVDNKGGRHHYVGHARDGNMYYEAEAVRFGPPGAPMAKVRMTFFDEGKQGVRQYIEQSTDGGKTWTVAFDGRYRRRQPGAEAGAVTGP